MNIVDTSDTSNTSTFLNSVINSLPSENGLWMFKTINRLPESFFNTIDNLNLCDIAYTIINNMVDTKLSSIRLKEIIKKAFFFPIELHKLNDNLHVLETFHGPTMTFKDFGGRFLAEYIKEVVDDNKKYMVLVSTSGDTGSAIASAFKNSKNISVIILYPNKKISDIQERQITTYYDNIYAFALDNTFDDCQNFVKRALKEPNVGIHFISANSINIARLIPQTLYYFYTYSILKKKDLIEDRNIVFSVPCGNCGNLTAGLIAKAMGLPIKFIVSQNHNDALVRYIDTGNFIPKKSVQTISNAMDVGNPSNIKRIMYLYDDIADLKEDVCTSYSSDLRTKETIKNVWETYNYILDPHTAVAYNGFIDHQKSHPKTVYIIVSTAHPIKFAPIITKLLKIKIPTPPQLDTINNKLIEKYIIKNDYTDFIDVIQKWSNKTVSITFIGMPGAGKSTISKKLSSLYNIRNLELDDIIELKYKMTLFDLINEYGEDGFKNIEKHTVLDITFDRKQIISTGGSIIYCEDAMEYLKNSKNLIIYLKADFNDLDKRTNNFKNRGIVFNGNTPEELYNERDILYEKYSDIKIETKGLDIDFIVNMCRSFI